MFRMWGSLKKGKDLEVENEILNHIKKKKKKNKEDIEKEDPTIFLNSWSWIILLVAEFAVSLGKESPSILSSLLNAYNMMEEG